MRLRAGVVQPIYRFDYSCTNTIVLLTRIRRRYNMSTVQEHSMTTKIITDRPLKSFDWYWANYVAKLARLDELKALGRYGYQLRMPKKAIAIAATSLRDYCNASGIECPPCVTEGR